MKPVITDKAPKAIGPYAHAVVHNGLAYCSGQLPIDPATGKFAGATIGEQTRQVMKNLSVVLEECGSGLDRILKTTVLLSSMDDFQCMNEVYGEMLDGHKPARIAFQVGRLPQDALVEIECIAALNDN